MSADELATTLRHAHKNDGRRRRRRRRRWRGERADGELRLGGESDNLSTQKARNVTLVVEGLKRHPDGNGLELE